MCVDQRFILSLHLFIRVPLFYVLVFLDSLHPVLTRRYNIDVREYVVSPSPDIYFAFQLFAANERHDQVTLLNDTAMCRVHTGYHAVLIRFVLYCIVFFFFCFLSPVFCFVFSLSID
jgi:hypothetical protein